MKLESLDQETQAPLLAIAALPDDWINLSDPDAWERLRWMGGVRGRFHKTEFKSLRVDTDVLAFFEVPGPVYQTRINSVLRESMIKELRRTQAKRA